MSRSRPMTGTENLISRLITNSIVGLVLLFLTNLFLAEDIPINLLIIICAIAGVGGWILILILNLLGVAF